MMTRLRHRPRHRSEPAVHDPSAATTPTSRSEPSGRVTAIDALRGVALAGIVVINIGQTFAMSDMPEWIGLVFFRRFFVLFSLLFGLGFGILLQGRAATTAGNPRAALLRRLLILGGMGAVHVLLQPGEVLWLYAATGMLILVPLSYAPRAVVAVVGVVALVAAMVTIGTVALVPGLFAVGLALARYDVHRWLPDRRGLLALLTVAFTVATVAAAWAARELGVPVGLGTVPTLQAFAYATGVLFLAASPLGRPFEAIFAPFGRMALTNYVTQTLLFLAGGTWLGLRGSADWSAAVGLAFAIVVLQLAWSPLWLSRYRYGPLEWVWRCGTWWQRVPLRRHDPVRQEGRVVTG
jgi:uncharacterized protein